MRKITLGASYGDAFLSALACKDVKKIDITKWNKVSNQIKHKKNKTYETGYKYFRELYESTKNLMKKMDD